MSILFPGNCCIVVMMHYMWVDEVSFSLSLNLMRVSLTERHDLKRKEEEREDDSLFFSSLIITSEVYFTDLFTEEVLPRSYS
jgi:hypothetical protein